MPGGPNLRSVGPRGPAREEPHTSASDRTGPRPSAAAPALPTAVANAAGSGPAADEHLPLQRHRGQRIERRESGRHGPETHHHAPPRPPARQPVPHVHSPPAPPPPGGVHRPLSGCPPGSAHSSGPPPPPGPQLPNPRHRRPLPPTG